MPPCRSAVTPASHDAPALPRTSTERQVAEILAGLLRLKTIGRDDNFFLLGGHSLLGAQLISRLRNAFDVEIGLQKLFEAPTVAALAAEISRLTSSGDDAPRGTDRVAGDTPHRSEPLVSTGNGIELPPA